MTVLFGLNALNDTLTDRNGTEASLIACKTGLVMDGVPLTQSLRAHGAAPVVHRRYRADEASLFTSITPAAWWASVLDTTTNGVLAQYHNEPGIHADNVGLFVQKNIEVIRLAHADSRQVGVGVFPVGNPAESLISSGAFDKMLLELGARDALIVHEYFIDHPTAPSENGFLCGRLEWWAERMAYLGCACRSIIVGEYGRDLGGGVNDGPLAQPWYSDEEYAKRLLEGAREIYRPISEQYSVNITLDVFCMGTGYGKWVKWNMEGRMKVVQPLLDWNTQQPGGINVAQMVKRKVNNPGGINVRNLPNGPTVLDTLHLGELVQVDLSSKSHVGLYDWWHVLTQTGINGWSADPIDGVTSFVDPTVPSGAPFIFKAPFWQYKIVARFNAPRPGYTKYPGKLLLHEGTDFEPLAPYDKDAVIHAGAAGTVTQVGYQAGGYGNFIQIDHGNEWSSWYAHLLDNSTFVKVGQKVKDYQVLGLMGSTGDSSEPHCHITIQNTRPGGPGLPNYVVADVVDPESVLVPNG